MGVVEGVVRVVGREDAVGRRGCGVNGKPDAHPRRVSVTTPVPTRHLLPKSGPSVAEPNLE